MGNNNSTIEYFDKNRYLGTWYEAATYPKPFEMDCGRVIAKYGIRKDNGLISVTNICCTPKGPRSRVAQAWIPDENDPGKLQLQFIDKLPGSKYVGDYWIHETDYETYSIVGSPDKRFFWILVRQRTISRQFLEFLIQRGESYGYSRDQLKINQYALSNF